MTVATTIVPTLCLQGILLEHFFIQLGPFLVLVYFSDKRPKLPRFLALPNNTMKMT